MKYYQFVRIVDEIIPQLGGARAQKVFQSDAFSVQIELFIGGQMRYLTVCTRPGQVALYLAASRAGTKGIAASDLAMKLRSHLRGTACTGAAPVPGDRVLRLDFSSKTGKCSLVVELFGVGGNLFLLDGQQRVAAVMNHKAASRRGLLPGAAYSFPKPPDKVESTVDKKSDPLAQLMERDELPSYNRAAELHYALLGAENALNQRRAELRRELNRERKRLVRLVTGHHKTVAEAEKAGWYSECGDILAANFRSLRKGQFQARLPDYYAAGRDRMRVIPLDEKLSPQQNMERYFKKSRKLRGGAEFALANLSGIETKLEQLEQQLAAVDSAADPDSLDRIAAGAGLESSGRAAGKKATQVPQRRLPYRAFEAADGSRIMVGKGGRDNDELTFKVARGRDVWLHVADSPGSHVVLCSPDQDKINHEALLDAAQLAVQYSSLKGEPQADVDYTRRKHISRPPNSAPGLVTMANRKTLRVRIDPKRLERLFKHKRR